jgi:hypothetical protein
MVQQSSNKLNNAAIAFSAAKIGANVAAMATKSAYSGITQGMNLTSLVSELRSKFTPKDQSKIINAVIPLLEGLSNNLLAKNNAPGVSADKIMSHKLASAAIVAAKSLLNGALGTANIGFQAYGEANKHLNAAQTQGATVPRVKRGGKTHKRKTSKYRKSRRRV